MVLAAAGMMELDRIARAGAALDVDTGKGLLLGNGLLLEADIPVLVPAPPMEWLWQSGYRGKGVGNI